MSISATFIKRPIGTSLLAAALFLVGVAAWPLLPVAPLPQVDFPTIQVSVTLPGADPSTMASNVATPLERQFSLIAGLTQMTSTSALGTTSITLQFDLNRNIDAAAVDVQAAINAAGGQLPSNLPSPPTYRKINPADSPILLMSVKSDTLPLTVVNDYADNVLAQQISQIDGVGLVNIGGVQKPAIRIQLDPDKVAALGLDLETVRGALASATVNAPKGSFDGPRQSVTVYDNGQLLSPVLWNEVIVAYRGGAPVRVRDLGQAVAGPENARFAGWAFRGAAMPESETLKSGRSVFLAVTKQPGANVIATVERIKAALPRLQASIPPAVEVNILTDRTQTIRASVEDVEFTLVLTGVLVVLVIFLFLRNLPATLIPAVTVPLAMMGTAAVMYLIGFSLDNLSLMALTISVGFVVDDAIVMLENIYRHVEDGMDPMEAAYRGAAEIGFTIVSISVSLVAVFIPLLLMGGIVGRLFREFAITVTLTIAISVIVSLTLTPMLCSRFLRHTPPERHGRLYRWFEAGFDHMQNGYRRGLQVVLAHQFITLLVFLATLVLTAMLYIVIPKGFFPQQDTGFVFGFAESAQDTSFTLMSERVVRVADVVRQDPDVLSFVANTGNNTANTANFYINLKPKAAGRTLSADQVIARLRPKLAQLEGINLFLQAGQDINVGGRLARTQYQYTLTDADINELNHWAPLLLERLRRLPQLTDLATDQQSNAATATLTIDRDRASSFGISPALIEATLYNAIGQRQIAQYFTQINSYHVVMEVTPALQADPALLDKLYLMSPTTGNRVPLSTFVRIDRSKTNYLLISHQSQFPAVTLSFNLAPGVSLGEAVDAIRRTQAQMNLPLSLNGNFQGTAQAFRDSLSTQPYLILAALVAVYIVLGLLYESYIHPLTILSTLPSAGVGALLILMLGGHDLSVIALIGIILLIGIVKKNGIMMVDFALTAERDHGLSPEASIYQACLLRFRPIMMTTMCALLAGLPLMLGTGAGSELRRPLGYAMVGGLVLSQALTLFTTPVIYLYLDRASLWFRERKARRAQQGAQAPE
ncbi:efflux RND transporter permease subunit [Pandoraea fibrosis]|uniref:Acriflavine resistance protein B n=1 Tax=Pandoraea fibrosis TaxID=1891094 RepID=A0A5E4SVZ6_9BURK|nr:efflux RND transporter permease subunit [Pandoraea fibrosis]QHE91906.1 MMPL family transporter [Pandoraea fibrosis]QHF14537.1 MMPL family transporter [Pandoraea fibrosis]VVD78923.1 acriflavine resistance protein B [Pandoraea fibrosis]